MSAKPLDVTLFGATGFTGRLAALYIARQYASSGLRWAIAGRSSEKLGALREECGGRPEVVVADSADADAVAAMARQTKVLVSFAGPFSRYSTTVVKACAELGTDYCDITGETDWVREMIATYDDVARRSGARIVHFCGHDCVPWDLMVLMMSKKLKEANAEESLEHVDMYDDLKSQPSGGTMETMMGAMYGPESQRRNARRTDYDPLLKCGDGPSTNSVKAANVGGIQFGSGSEPHRTFFVMAAVNANTIKRSNALLNYSTRFTYSEGLAHESAFSAISSITGLGFFGLGLALPPTRWLLRNYVLPKPGEGPSEEFMEEEGYLTVSGVARGDKGSVVKARMHFPVDPGYKDTARMAVESGLALVLDGGLPSVRGGSYTPAACQGEKLLNRLLATGTEFAFE